MTRREAHLTHDHVKAAVEMVTGALVTARSGTPDEAWAWREEVPRCGTVYMVKGPLVNGEATQETRAHDTPGKAIEDLAERRAPKPAHLCPTCSHKWRDCACHKPDELTVEDVLGVLNEALKRAGKRGVDMGKCLFLRRVDAVDVLVGTWAPEFTGTLDEALTWAKRRGLLG